MHHKQGLYSELPEGYVTGLALDENDEVIGYQFVSLGKMTDFIKNGDDPNTAWEKAKGQYGRVADAVKIIDPRKENLKWLYLNHMKEELIRSILF